MLLKNIICYFLSVSKQICICQFYSKTNVLSTLSKNPEFAKPTKSEKHKILMQKTLLKNILQLMCSKMRIYIHQA